MAPVMAPSARTGKCGNPYRVVSGLSGSGTEQGRSFDGELSNLSGLCPYPTSPIAEIKALDVRSIAATDCVLFLWVTVPMLEHAFGVMRAWPPAPSSALRRR
jgi:hypothetical protein